MIHLHRFSTQAKLFQQASATALPSSACWVVHPHAQLPWQQYVNQPHILADALIQAWQAYEQQCVAHLHRMIAQDQAPIVQAIEAKEALAQQVWALAQNALSPIDALQQQTDPWLARYNRWLSRLPAFDPPDAIFSDAPATCHWVGFWPMPAMLQATLETTRSKTEHHIWWVDQTHEPTWLKELAPKQDGTSLSFFPKEVDAYHYTHVQEGLDHVHAWLQLPQWSPERRLGVVIESPVTRAWLNRQTWFDQAEGLQLHPWHQSAVACLLPLLQTWVHAQPRVAPWIDCMSQWALTNPEKAHACFAYLVEHEVMDREHLTYLSNRQDFPDLARDWLTLVRTIENHALQPSAIDQALDAWMQAWSDPNDVWHTTLQTIRAQGLPFFGHDEIAWHRWLRWLCLQEQRPESMTARCHIGTLAYVAQQNVDHVLLFDPWVQPLFQQTASLFPASGASSFAIASAHQQVEAALIGFQRQDASLVYIHPHSQQGPSLLRHPLVDTQPIGFTQQRARLFEAQPHEALLSSWQTYQTQLNAADFPASEKQLPDTGQPLSPSSLQTLATCPRKFYLRHRLRLQEKTAATELLRQPGHLFGTMIHQVMHAWYDQADKNRTDAHAFGQLFETHAKKFSPLLSQAYKPLWHEEMRHIQACLWAYIQQEAENSWQPIEGEMTLAPTVLSWLHPTLRFHGQIDRIDQQGQTQRIIDYKTGKFDKKKTDLWEDGQFVQLPMYTALLEATNHTPVAQSEIHHVKPTGVTRAFVLDQAQWQSQRDSFQALMKQLLTHIDQQTFAPDPGPRMQHCTYCDFQVICGRFRQKALESNT